MSLAAFKTEGAKFNRREQRKQRKGTFAIPSVSSAASCSIRSSIPVLNRGQAHESGGFQNRGSNV